MPLTNAEVEYYSLMKQAAQKYTKQEIDWEQRRYEIARDLLVASYSRAEVGTHHIDTAIELADTLIEKLKNKHTS